MKKFISIFLLCSFILLLFASCMSKEEKQQARENEKIARPMLERYVDENYNGAVVEDVECLTNTHHDLFVATYATDYVKANVSYKENPFNVVVDLETGEFYNDYYQQKIADEMKSLVFGEIPVEKPRDVEIRFMLNDFVDFVDDGWGYLEEDMDSVEDLLKTDRYQIFVLCKYANSQMDFESIPIKSFFKNEYKSDIQIAFVNYRDEIRYDNEDVLDCKSISSLSLLFNDENDFYNVSDLKWASQVNEKEWQSDGKSTTELVYDEEYKHYKSKIYNNIEFIWNDEYYDIDFSETIAESVVVTKYYSGDPFYATSPKAVKLNCTKVTDKEMDYSNRVYMYFPKDMYGEYLIIESNGTDDVKRLDWKRKEYVYQYEILCDYNLEFTLGFYKRANTEQK